MRSSPFPTEHITSFEIRLLPLKLVDLYHAGSLYLPLLHACFEYLLTRLPDSGAGYITGNQDLQTRGNIESGKANWEFKQGTSKDSAATVPVPSVEGAKGMMDSVKGMVQGDQDMQTQGNMRADKAIWKDGL